MLSLFINLLITNEKYLLSCVEENESKKYLRVTLQIFFVQKNALKF